MDIKDLKQIIDLMKRSELTELEIEETDLKLRLRREINGGVQPYIERGTRPALPLELQEIPTSLMSIPPSNAPVAAVEEKNVALIKSPMVGTFYRAPSPESSPFVQIGSNVNAESTVCIIEAMKVLNEIHAETTGSIVEVLVENGQAVEFGQPLFKVKQA